MSKLTTAVDKATDDGTILGVIHDGSATLAEQEYGVERLLSREDSVATTRMSDRINAMAHVGEGLQTIARRRFADGLVVGSDGKPTGPLASDEEVTVARIRQAFGMADKASRATFGTQSVDYNAVQRYYIAARASGDDIDLGMVRSQGEGKGDNLAATLTHVARATFERTDPTAARERAERQAKAKAEREQAKAEAKADAEAMSKAAPDKSPVVVDESWTLDQLRAIVVVVNARIAVVKAEQAKAEQDAKVQAKALADLASAPNAAETLRALLAKLEQEQQQEQQEQQEQAQS